MRKMTSAFANKMIKSLEEEKIYWNNKESSSCTYVAAADEEPVIPDYDYAEVAATIEQLDEKIAIIKHALNLANATAEVKVGDEVMSVDTILIKMSQLNRRKNVLEKLRRFQPKSRVENTAYGVRKSVPEYLYINFDMDLIRAEYDRISQKIMDMQLALDIYNQTFQFDVDLA